MHRRSVLFGLSALVATPLWATPDAAATQLVAAAQDQVGVTLIYDGSYRALDFPGGDISRLRGVCTDVIIRAMRDAWDIDLQLAINRDMHANFASYPANWGLTRPDRNIDHRRVPNLETLLTRFGAALPITSNPTAYTPADIVSWRLSGSNVPHIGIVSDRMTRDGERPLITHNIGFGTRTNDMLFDHRINGHFRITDATREKLRRLSA
ncbi:DUF1287 domain-containing protein [Parasulfitobacter algicola]|uniref:DUF1287 domain-containing protein n=1 Tax=Parasulfitobacter algicola TaxID=2614809 RepID=A0ABX2ITZ9_9RHOB|nr:DUF1287 domain-containing protein [Sulfitobacter algicola]NSX54307.1 DUF1287 domain-containing protein [Sulfitobacter algicola]